MTSSGFMSKGEDGLWVPREGTEVTPRPGPYCEVAEQEEWTECWRRCDASCGRKGRGANIGKLEGTVGRCSALTRRVGREAGLRRVWPDLHIEESGQEGTRAVAGRQVITFL